MSKLEVNLIDSGFKHVPLPGGLSVKVPTYINWIRDRKNYEGITVYTDGSINAGSIQYFGGKYKIALLWESPSINPSTYQNIISLEDMFDEIWTYDERLLGRKSSKYKFHIPFSNWITATPSQIEAHTKKTEISMIFSNKNLSPGHGMRHAVHGLLQHREGIVFSGSGRGPHISNDEREEIILDSLFTIVIENLFMKNLFTEKLIDALVCKTIPIFCGCSNVGEFFDERGIIAFSSGEQVLDITEKILLSPRALYDEMLPYAERNRDIVREEYCIPEDWIYKKRIAPFVEKIKGEQNGKGWG